MRRIFSILLLAGLTGGNLAGAHRHRRRLRPFVATAFAQRGTTASGLRTHRGEVAADTRILPLGTRIRVRNAGPYSGTYTVENTGSKVTGRHIDIFMPDEASARKFGKKIVQISILRRGES